MRVVQVIPTLAYGDAVGNDTLALKKVLNDMGYKSQIYAESIVPPLGSKEALDIKELQGIGCGRCDYLSSLDGNTVKL